jgi:AAHS family 4-hydroxybenzoate transporter-like MFS transporter
MTPERTLRVDTLIDRSKLSRMQLLVFILSALAFGIDGIDTQIIGYIAPSLLGFFHAPRTVLGGVFSAGLAGLLIGSLIVGPFADKYGRKNVIISSVSLFGVFTLISAFSSSIGELVLWRFVTGLGLGAAIPNLMALVSDYSPLSRRSTIIMLVASANAAGATLGGGLASYLVPLFGWRIMFYLGGAAPLVLAVFLWLYLEESISWLITKGRATREVIRIAERIGGPLEGATLVTDGVAGLHYGAFLKRYLCDRVNAANTLAIMFIYFMVMFEMFFVSSWATTMLTESGLTLKAAIQASSLFQTGGFVGMILIAFFAAGKDISRLFAWMLVASCAMIVATSFALGASPATISAMLFTTGFFLVPCLPSASSMVGRTYPVAIRASAFGAAYAAGRLGSVFGPLFGQKLHALGLPGQLIFMLSSLPCLFAALAVLVVYRNSAAQRACLVPVTE